MSEHFVRLGGQALAAILGGPGIFYVWYSFYDPSEAASAVVLLGGACAISLMLYPESRPQHEGLANAARWLARRLERLKIRF
jgi:ABC-type Fe3+ transport system permease subunit